MKEMESAAHNELQTLMLSHNLSHRCVLRLNRVAPFICYCAANGEQ
jgi:hypothetical protein